MSMQKTTPLYFENSSRLDCQATVQCIEEAIGFKEPNCHIVIVDQTICHPQGGGQPCDTGFISKGSSSTFQILDARVDRDAGFIQHIGRFSGEPFSVGDVVDIKIDEDKRFLYSQLHTAGHLLDACLHLLGYDWKPSKGYHYPDSPYVEYKGEVAQSELELIKSKLEEKALDLIAKDIPIIIRLDVGQDEARALCGELDPIHQSTPTLRLISIGEYFTGPCGGTHVQSLAKLKAIEVPKIKLNRAKGLIQVRYKVLN